jgi:hypothetical protein
MSYNPQTWRKNNPEKRLEQKRREKVRTALRKRGILPPPGEEMNHEQQLINEQISNNDFSYWDSIKLRTTKSGGNEKQMKVDLNNEHTLKDISNENLKKESYKINLEKSDILTSTHCPYLGIKLSYNKKDEKLDNYRSIDRIDNSKGYVKGNLQVISHLANKIKTSLTIEQLITFSQNVIKIHNGDFRV